ncbi:MAG TPA: class I SAM-dependent methyltransferase [Pyrinomonadaceae bacterium]|nr:class I SAM-dependent methyltransferase [Pyrinomonadaceae bacterium]
MTKAAKMGELGWIEKRRHQRAARALVRQREYQREKAKTIGNLDSVLRSVFLHSQAVRNKLAAVREIGEGDTILEVGSGAHGLVFGLGLKGAIGIDPLAVEYKRLFPEIQRHAATVASIGEELPFESAAFDVVLSDNVIDHGGRPLMILDEIVRVLKPGGVLYFTVNIHHPIYDLASRAHGLWNALGIKLELSAFADHTVHFSDVQIREAFSRLPLQRISESTTIMETKRAQRQYRGLSPDPLLKMLFFKNALYELVAIKNED